MTPETLRGALNLVVRNPLVMLQSATLPTDAESLLGLWHELQRVGFVSVPDLRSAMGARQLVYSLVGEHTIAGSHAGATMFDFVDQLMQAVVAAVAKQPAHERSVILASEVSPAMVQVGSDAGGGFVGFGAVPMSAFGEYHALRAAISDDAYRTATGEPIAVVWRGVLPHWIPVADIVATTRRARWHQLVAIADRQRSEHRARALWEQDANSDPVRLRREIARLSQQVNPAIAATG